MKPKTNVSITKCSKNKASVLKIFTVTFLGCASLSWNLCKNIHPLIPWDICYGASCFSVGAEPL